MSKDKIPTIEEIYEQMSVIPKLEDAVQTTARQSEEIRKEHSHRLAMLETAKNELGRMLTTANFFGGSDYRIVHRDQAKGPEMEAIFGLYRAQSRSE